LRQRRTACGRWLQRRACAWVRSAHEASRADSGAALCPFAELVSPAVPGGLWRRTTNRLQPGGQRGRPTRQVLCHPAGMARVARLAGSGDPRIPSGREEEENGNVNNHTNRGRAQFMGRDAGWTMAVPVLGAGVGYHDVPDRARLVPVLRDAQVLVHRLCSFDVGWVGGGVG